MAIPAILPGLDPPCPHCQGTGWLSGGRRRRRCSCRPASRQDPTNENGREPQALDTLLGELAEPDSSPPDPHEHQKRKKLLRAIAVQHSKRIFKEARNPHRIKRWQTAVDPSGQPATRLRKLAHDLTTLPVLKNAYDPRRRVRIPHGQFWLSLLTEMSNTWADPQRSRSALDEVIQAVFPVLPNLRPDPILPAGSLMIPAAGLHSEQRSLPASLNQSNSSPRTLPGFSDPRTPTVQVPAWLAAFDHAVGPLAAAGGTAPINLRLGTEFLAAVPLDRRAHRDGALLEFTVRDLVKWLRQNGATNWRVGRDWPALREALRFYDSDAARVRWLDPTTGDPTDRRVISLEALPPARGAGLNSRFHVRVLYPPGSENGPAVDMPRLRHWGARSALAYRGLIGLAYQWFRPGKSLYPIRRNKKIVHWRHADDPDRYDPLAPADLIALFYPSGEATVSSQGRRTRLMRIRRVLRALQDAGDIGRMTNGRILPPTTAGTT